MLGRLWDLISPARLVRPPTQSGTDTPMTPAPGTTTTTQTPAHASTSQLASGNKNAALLGIATPATALFVNDAASPELNISLDSDDSDLSLSQFIRVSGGPSDHLPSSAASLTQNHASSFYGEHPFGISPTNGMPLLPPTAMTFAPTVMTTTTFTTSTTVASSSEDANAALYSQPPALPPLYIPDPHLSSQEEVPTNNLWSASQQDQDQTHESELSQQPDDFGESYSYSPSQPVHSSSGIGSSSSSRFCASQPVPSTTSSVLTLNRISTEPTTTGGTRTSLQNLAVNHLTQTRTSGHHPVSPKRGHKGPVALKRAAATGPSRANGSSGRGRSVYSLKKHEFMEKALPISANVNGTYVTFEPKSFGTPGSSSFGYVAATTVPIVVDGHRVEAQFTGKLVITNTRS